MINGRLAFDCWLSAEDLEIFSSLEKKSFKVDKAQTRTFAVQSHHTVPQIPRTLPARPPGLELKVVVKSGTITLVS